MIEHLRVYMFSIIGASLVCAIGAVILGKESSGGKVFKLLSALTISVVVLAPLVHIKLGDFDLHLNSIYTEAEMVAKKGKAYADAQRRIIIMDGVQTYILEKARALGAEITVEVVMDQQAGDVPSGVIIVGNLSPYTRSVLSATISEDLGIPEEAQKWN